ncbi:NfeD family protein [Psychrobacter frigidicola]|uniref:NfeD family protein n=1 Tax=Psychrobacter frigidicola TaxID=45611 RepID=A0A5C7A248_9GAMM|nr:NfeD family protein [Psychrobacter frigidicola]
MIETIYMIEPWHWLVLGFLLMIAEMFIPTFASLWFGAAAVIVAALSWLLPISLLWQVLIWLSLSVIFMLAWFKYIKPLSVNRTKAGLGGSVIIGETGMIVAKPQADALGRVRFSVPIVGADEWFCRTRDEEVEVGDRVVVTEIIGNELIVALTKRITAPVVDIVIPTPIVDNRPIINRRPVANKLSLKKAELNKIDSSH